MMNGPKIDVEIHQELSPGRVAQAPDEPFPRTYMRREADDIARVVKPIDASLLRDHIAGLVKELAGGLKPGPDGPKSCEVTFSVKIGAEGNVIVSKFAAEAQLQVKVTWER